MKLFQDFRRLPTRLKLTSAACAIGLAVIPQNVYAGSATTSSGVTMGVIFAMFALVLVAGKIGNFVERYGQPAVVGELFAGIVLSAVGYAGWDFIAKIATNDIIGFIAQFGALVLLFSIGLESNLATMKKVGPHAAAVAVIGVVAPFIAGYFVLAPLFYPDASVNAKLFFGAALVATSVGIAASVFRSLGVIRTQAAQTVLGAAVIDDILGLIVLAVVSALAAGGTITAGSVAIIVLKSFGFLVGALSTWQIVCQAAFDTFQQDL